MASIISGTSIPQILMGAEVVEHGDSFIIIGGRNRDKTLVDKIYQYDATSGGWTELQTTIGQGKWHCYESRIIDI